MFFVFGSPRSGTTLLARMLNAHPDLAVPHETDGIVPLCLLHDRIPDPVLRRRLISEMFVATRRFAAGIGDYLDAPTVTKILQEAEDSPAAMLRAVYAGVAGASGARMAGDKTPNDLNQIRVLDRAGLLAAPNRCIHIVRDVRDVLASLLARGWSDGLERYFARQWSQANLYLAQMAPPTQYLLLRYEDLVRDPEAELERACAFLGVAFDACMLEPEARRHPRYDAAPQHARLALPVDTAAIGAFRHSLDPALANTFLEQAVEAMHAFGYAPRTLS